MTELLIKSQVSECGRALIWDTFFASRGRGISLAKHSPWLDQADAYLCLEARHDEVLVGALVIKFHPGAWGRIGMIGYVCVAPRHQGKGFGRQLVCTAIEVARRERLTALVLWTRNPAIYHRHGFARDGNQIFRKYAPLPKTEGLHAIQKATWPGHIDQFRGLPPYALSGYRVRGDNASATVVETADGPSVAEWDGEPEAVLSLLMASLSGAWMLNAFSGDHLIHVLGRHGVAVVEEFPPSAMWLPLTDKSELAPPLVRLLDRI